MVAGLAALGITTFALTVLGGATLFVGIFVLAIERIYWPTLTGCLLLLGALGVGRAAYKRMLRIKAFVERPRRRNQVFISYRTAEHAEAAARAATLLRGEGWSVYFAEAGELHVDPSHRFYAFRALGLFQLGELDSDLQRALNKSDAMVYFVPKGRRPAIAHMLRDHIDALGSLLLFQSGMTPTFWRYLWYMGIFERSIEPASVRRAFTLSSWQSWELAVARQLGVVVVKVALGQTQIDSRDEELVGCREEALESDFDRMVLPRLRQQRRVELEVRGPLPAVLLALVGWLALQGVALLSLAGIASFLVLRTLL